MKLCGELVNFITTSHHDNQYNVNAFFSEHLNERRTPKKPQTDINRYNTKY